MLNLMLNLVHLIPNDEHMRDTEFNIIRSYVTYRGLFNITPKEWRAIKSTGEDVKSFIKDEIYYFVPEENATQMAKLLWEELEDVPFSDEENVIEADFHWWEKGTDRFEVWNDIENLFNVSIYEDLMFH